MLPSNMCCMAFPCHIATSATTVLLVLLAWPCIRMHWDICIICAVSLVMCAALQYLNICISLACFWPCIVCNTAALTCLHCAWFARAELALQYVLQCSFHDLVLWLHGIFQQHPLLCIPAFSSIIAWHFFCSVHCYVFLHLAVCAAL